VPATGIMRTLQTGDRPTRLAQALAEFGRIEKTLHTLTYIDDESKRRATLTQLNRGEGRTAWPAPCSMANAASFASATAKARRINSVLWAWW
jgi:TnpA family transposase